MVLIWLITWWAWGRCSQRKLLCFPWRLHRLSKLPKDSMSLSFASRCKWLILMQSSTWVFWLPHDRTTNLLQLISRTQSMPNSRKPSLIIYKALRPICGLKSIIVSKRLAFPWVMAPSVSRSKLLLTGFVKSKSSTSMLVRQACPNNNLLRKVISLQQIDPAP